VLIPPALIETKQMGSFSTNFQRPGQYELNPSGSLALEMALPISTRQISDNRLVLHMKGHYSGDPRNLLPSSHGTRLGQYFLYNWQSSTWDPQTLRWGDNAVNNPSAYLSATSTVRVRYTYKAPPQAPTASIQFSLDLTDQGRVA
ncbi:MAG: hypothetical protein ACYDAG_15485, partial [Chloroflexota bacterium]